MRRPALLIAGYVGATILVTGVAVGGVRLVTDQVVEPLPPISASLAGESASASASESQSPTPDPDATSDDPSGDSSTEPGDDRSGSGGPDDPTSSPTGSTTSTPSPTATPTSPSSPTASPTQSPSDDDHSESDDDHSESPSPTPTSTSQQSELRSYQVVGGSVTLRFSPAKVEVVSVSPNPGFRVEIEDEGYELRVDFESETHRSRVKGWWENGPRDEVKEESR